MLLRRPQYCAAGISVCSSQGWLPARRPLLYSKPRAQRWWGYLLDAALIHALLPKELHLERLAHVQPCVLDLQQRVVHQVLPPPHLQAQRQQPAQSHKGLPGNLRRT